MQVLPLRYINNDDLSLVGSNIVALANLHQLGFETGDIFVITPPQNEFEKILKRFQDNYLEVLEQNFDAVLGELQSISIPEELEDILEERGKKSIGKKVWQDLIRSWAVDLRSNIQRNDLKNNISDGLIAKHIVFSNTILAQGICFYDKSKSDSVIQIEEGKLSPMHLYQLNKLVETLSKKLFIPQVIYWLLEKSSKKPLFSIIKIWPLTPDIIHEDQDFSDFKILQSEKISEQKNPVTKSAVKIYAEIDELQTVNGEVDGILVKSPSFKDDDQLIQALINFASVSDNNVFFQISHPSIKPGILEKEASVFNFVKNKKLLLNVQIVLPPIKSIKDLSIIKRNLALLGISRVGNNKLWLCTSVPENILNIKEYITLGIDGLILDLDELSKHLNGDEPEKLSAGILIHFLENSLKELNKARIPTLAKGNLALNGRILKFLVKNGLFGVLAAPINCLGLSDYLRMIERQIFLEMEK